MVEWWMDEFRFASRIEWRFWVYPMHGMYTTRVSVNSCDVWVRWRNGRAPTVAQRRKHFLSALGIIFYFQQGTTLFHQMCFREDEKKKYLQFIYTNAKRPHLWKWAWHLGRTRFSWPIFALSVFFFYCGRRLVELILCDSNNFPFSSHGRVDRNALHQLSIQICIFCLHSPV